LHRCKELKVKDEEGDEGASGGGDELLELLVQQLPPALCSCLAQLTSNTSLQRRCKETAEDCRGINRGVLSYIVLSYTVLSYTVLSYTVLSYTGLSYTVLSYT